MRRLVWAFAGRTYNIVGNLMSWLKYSYQSAPQIKAVQFQSRMCMETIRFAPSRLSKPIFYHPFYESRYYLNAVYLLFKWRVIDFGLFAYHKKSRHDKNNRDKRQAMT